MEENILIYTKHYLYSVVEVYLSNDHTKVYQVKCLTRNRCRKYTFDTQHYIDGEMLAYNLIKNKLK